MAVLVAAFVLMVTLVPSTTATRGGAVAAVTNGRAAGTPVTGDVGTCPGRALQVPGDSYSPKCVSFTGANGGATATGVTKDSIVVSYRKTLDGDLISALEQLLPKTNGLKVDTAQDVYDTMSGLVDYFNKNFQFYGRKIKLTPFAAKGTVTNELFGSGQDTATADAVQAATSLHPFADVTGVTSPYADALTKRKVIALGIPYVSDQWFQQRRPYAWSTTPSCTLVTQASAETGVKQLINRPAVYAGGDLKNRPRKIAVIAPDNPEYQRCTKAGQEILRKAGGDFSSITYSLNFATLADQAAAITTKLKSEGVTSITCACDPVLPIYLTKKAKQQNYFPEWNVIGVGLTDSDLAGQLYDQDEWSHAFGGTALGTQLPVSANRAALALKSVRPNQRPANVAEVLYYQLYQLAIGIQLAGPDLTPATFEAGMFAYPEHTGDAGAWKWGPGKYTPQVDVQQIWWDRSKRSVFDGALGAYVPIGPRYRQGQVPNRQFPPLPVTAR